MTGKIIHSGSGLSFLGSKNPFKRNRSLLALLPPISVSRHYARFASSCINVVRPHLNQH
jgi:hypothetical protein